MSNRVLMICSQFPPVYGGAGGQAALLSRELARKGWRVRVTTLDQQGVGSEDGADYAVRRTLRGVEPTGFWTRLLTTIALTLISCREVIFWRPNIVHVHGAYWWSVLPVALARCVGAKTVVKSTRDGEDDARTVLKRRVRGVPIGLLYGLSIRLCDAFIVLNRKSYEDALRLGLSKKVHLMRNGVDSDVYARTTDRVTRAREAYGLSETDRVVLFVGYLVRHKGVLDLLEAWRWNDDRESQLWLVGPNSGFYRELDGGVDDAIQSLISSGFQIRVLGHLPSTELPQIYWASNVYTLPSYAEGMPNSLLEAMSAGCEIVASEIPGIVDAISSHSAWLVPPGDTAELASALSEAIAGTRRMDSSVAVRVAMTSVVEDYEFLYGSSDKDVP